MDAQLERLYSTTGRPSIAPERLLRATRLMILFSIRSERQSMERQKITLGADTRYQDERFVQDLRDREAAPHIGEYTQGVIGARTA